MNQRTLARAAAALCAATLVAGPMAGTAGAAAKKKPPAPTITQKPPARTNVQTATFAFTDSQAGVTFQCSLDAAAFTACTSPKTYTGLPAGVRGFRVRALSGTLASPASSVSWTIDLTPPPAPTLTGIPSSPTKATSAAPAFTDTEAGVTYRCSADGAASAPCTSPASMTALADGVHTFAVTAVDAAGNESAPANASWTVDTTPPPAPTFTTGPASITNSTTADFVIQQPDPNATLTCSLDGAAFAACTTTPSYTSLSEAAHTLEAKATDAAGNSATSQQFAWTVDTTAPTPPTILTHPDAVTKLAVAAFTFDPHDATQLRCAIDSTTDYSDCAASYSTPSLADGSHTLRVLGRDAATNESGATPYTWTVDSTPPPAPAVTGPGAFSNDTSPTFGITDTEALVTFTCALDAAAAAPCPADGTYAGPLLPGPHTLVVTASDAAGNTASTPYAWTIDTTAPTATVSSPATQTAPVVATFSEPVSGVGAASFALRVAGTATNLPASIACTNAAAATVSCATGAVSKATLRPSSPLVLGQRYDAVLNVGTAAIVDRASNALAAKTAAFRAPTATQENGPTIRYTWRPVPNAAALGSSYLTEHQAGAALTYPFTGTAITWYTVTGPSQGWADVYVDGVKKAAVSNYARTTAYRVPRLVSGLTTAPHTLRIVARGTRAAASATGTFVSVDAVKVGPTLVASPAMGQSWRTAPMAGASGGSMASADLPNQQITFTFRGNSLSWWTSTGPNRGKAQVWVDGVLKATFDTYSATTALNVRRLVSGLADTTHSAKLVVLGAHRAGATGNLVYVDRFTVG